MTTPIDKAEIRRLIPHAGTMCLLDSVLGWDDESIVCTTNTHRDEANPLRRDGRLSALHALEYGAQAAAIHGGLRARAAGTTAPPCYLAAMRDAHLHVARLDDLAGDMQMRDRKSTRLNSSHVRISYAVFCLKKKHHAVRLTRSI